MAKRTRAPSAKKRLDYKKQRRGFSEYAHALRGGKWRRNKRRPAQQAVRQAERRAVAHSEVDPRDPGFDPGVLRRPTISKWTASSLGDWVREKIRARVERVGARTRRKARRP